MFLTKKFYLELYVLYFIHIVSFFFSFFSFKLQFKINLKHH